MDDETTESLYSHEIDTASSQEPRPPQASLLQPQLSGISVESFETGPTSDDFSGEEGDKAVKSYASYQGAGGSTASCTKRHQTKKSSIVQKKERKYRYWMDILRAFALQVSIQVAILMIYLISKQTSDRLLFLSEKGNSHTLNDCIYITGGGFSGFWYSLGVLHSNLQKTNTKDIVCYSGGCLSAVATYSNYTRTELYEIARNATDQWLMGEISRYDVVEVFVDGLLRENKKESSELGRIRGNYDHDDINEDSSMEALSNSLNRLHILTAVVDPKSAMLVGRMQTSTNLRHLRKLLMQTTWIPHVTGSHFSYQGHLDGSFSRWQHPSCNHNIGLHWDIDVLMYTLNPNIPPDLVAKFWNMGLQCDGL